MTLFKKPGNNNLRLLLWGVVILVVVLVILLLENIGLFTVIGQIGILLVSLILSVDQAVFWIIALVGCCLIALTVIPRKPFLKGRRSKTAAFIPESPAETWAGLIEQAKGFPPDPEALIVRLEDLQNRVYTEDTGLLKERSDPDVIGKLRSGKRKDLLEAVVELVVKYESALEIDYEE